MNCKLPNRDELIKSNVLYQRKFGLKTKQTNEQTKETNKTKHKY